ncbi:putative ORFan [Cotonvirus japonicus]|uniref:ORFan n=1 Tax=Cotonvirus japonicus TaxID=2811091 RepID=A0ABM7NRT3_9VIRU|nr:putative ORFan [Cotonvirus japonicus]BCS82874.1 putative ORFan [Cotonvirus japonicus]
MILMDKDFCRVNMMVMEQEIAYYSYINITNKKRTINYTLLYSTMFTNSILNIMCSKILFQLYLKRYY